ncbi:hypothetical protein Anas_11975 [Armadillidium nasatum]|uniref:Uncharacterized protein n=1 Tax=Armadillidium nasatum TaxID=96803 RepID=A0A5N5TDS0_9CRUS|nr:hypothetical protein Anas_11975 [Armadillidium nasatum]
MKATPILISFLAIYSATLTKAAPAPEPFFDILANAATSFFNTAAHIVGGAFDIFFGAIRGIVGGALGGILGGILGSGRFGVINTDPNKGGCQAENVAKIIEHLFKVLDIPVVECDTHADCYEVGIGICGPVKGISNTKNICLLTR